jgi:hypothetical protein
MILGMKVSMICISSSTMKHASMDVGGVINYLTLLSCSICKILFVDMKFTDISCNLISFINGMINYWKWSFK